MASQGISAEEIQALCQTPDPSTSVSQNYFTYLQRETKIFAATMEVL